MLKVMNESNDFERYTYVTSKDVNDSDGFRTEYTMYYDEVEDRYVFILGDSDYYNPNDGYEEFDWECDTEQEAKEWFSSYEGFSDEFESKKESKVTEATSVLSPDRMHKILRNWLNAQDEVELFNAANDDGYYVYSYGATDYDKLSKNFEEYLRKTVNWNVSREVDEDDPEAYRVICSKPTNKRWSTEFDILFTNNEGDDDADIYIEIQNIY